MTRHLDYMESELAKFCWFAGDEFSAADIQMSFPLATSFKNHESDQVGALSGRQTRRPMRPAIR